MEEKEVARITFSSPCECAWLIKRMFHKQALNDWLDILESFSNLPGSEKSRQTLWLISQAHEFGGKIISIEYKTYETLRVKFEFPCSETLKKFREAIEL